MGLSAEVANARIYEELGRILLMINNGKSMEEIKAQIEFVMDKCSKEM